MGGYYSIRGRQVWVEDRAASVMGDDTTPMLLLHGGLDHSGTLLGAFDSTLRKSFRLTAFDRSGCGRSPTTPHCFTFDDKASQVIAFIEDYLRQPVHIVGYSDGGNAALTVAVQRPDVLASMTLIGANFHFSGVRESVMPPMDAIVQSYVGSPTAALSPDDGEQAALNAAATWRMWASEPTFTPALLSAIATPTLIIAGDDEPIDPHHTVTMFESLSNAKLAIVPGATHAVPTEKPELVAHLISDFLSQRG